MQTCPRPRPFCMPRRRQRVAGAVVRGARLMVGGRRHDRGVAVHGGVGRAGGQPGGGAGQGRASGGLCVWGVGCGVWGGALVGRAPCALQWGRRALAGGAGQGRAARGCAWVEWSVPPAVGQGPQAWCSGPEKRALVRSLGGQLGTCAQTAGSGLQDGPRCRRRRHGGALGWCAPGARRLRRLARYEAGRAARAAWRVVAQAVAGSLQSLCWGSAAVGGILSAYWSGSLVESVGTR